MPHIVEKLLTAMGKHVPDHRVSSDGTVVTHLRESTSLRRNMSYPRTEAEAKASVPESFFPIPGLTDIDNIVLRSICEQAVQKNSEMIDPDELYTYTDALKIDREEVLDSMEVLDGRGYVKASRVLGGMPRGISHLRPTTMGFGVYAQAYIDNFADLRWAVATTILNKQSHDNAAIVSAVGARKFVVDHILNEFETLGWLQLSKSLGGSVHILSVSPELKRAFR